MKKAAPIMTALYLFFSTSTPAKAAWEGECVAEGSVPTIKGLECLFGNILSVMLTLLGIAAFIMILVAGFKLLTSGGNPEQKEMGQKTLTWAVGGLAAAIIVWFLFRFIADFTGLGDTLLNFNVFINQ